MSIGVLLIPMSLMMISPASMIEKKTIPVFLLSVFSASFVTIGIISPIEATSVMMTMTIPLSSIPSLA